MDNVFFGPDGLRPGWSLVLAASIYLVTLSAAGIVLQALPSVTALFAAPDPHVVFPGTIFLNECLSFGLVAFVTWIMSRIEGRPIAAFGLGRRAWLKHLLGGAVTGLLSLSLLIAALRACGLLVFDRSRLPAGQAAAYAVEWAAAFLLVGLFEEYAFRGYLQVTLARAWTGLFGTMGGQRSESWGFWSAAFVTSCVFGWRHSSNTGESPAGLLAAAVVALLFCLSLWRTGSLWWAVGFHAAWDWAQSFLYGVADSGSLVQGHLVEGHAVGSSLLSGGTTGPEGSLLVFPAILFAAIALLLTLPRRPRLH